MAEPDFGMDKADMKKLLNVSKKQPVHCAIGLTKGGVVLMMDKIKQPKALVKELEKKFSDMKSPHWGEALVDTDEDPKLVILTLNKAAPGMARQMKKTLKGTGFSKVEIRLEDGTVADKVGEDDEEDAAQADGAKPGAPAAAAAPAAPQPPPPEPPPAAAQAASSQQPPAAPEAAAAPSAPSGEAAALTKQLTDLVKRMAANPAAAAAGKAFAAQAQASLKSGDVKSATASIKQLQETLDQAPDPARIAAMGKARVAWTATRKKVEGELDKLHKEMTEVYKDHGFGAQLDKVFHAKVEPMLANLDESLSSKLDEVTKNTDPASHAKLVGEAKQIVQKYEQYIAGEKLIAKLDANPFVPLQIEKTLHATLEALGKAIA